jgi:hypothetical protein
LIIFFDPKHGIFKLESEIIRVGNDNLDDIYIYIVRNRNGISAQKLSNILTRNDIKKSEAFKSDFLEGTVPTYDSYMQLKKAIVSRKKK